MLNVLLLSLFLSSLALEEERPQSEEPGGTDFHSEELTGLQEELVSGWSNASMQAVWSRLGSRLARRLEQVAGEGAGLIPVTSLRAIKGAGGRLPDRVADRVRSRGVLVVRGVLDKEAVQGVETDLLNYLQDNAAFLANMTDPVYPVFWSRAQMSARSHPDMVATMGALLQLWRTEEDRETDLGRPLLFMDRLHRRAPGTKTGLSPLGESWERRWQEPGYSQVYRHILVGQPESYDPWLADHRTRDGFSEAGGATFFRGFQGWLSLSSLGAGGGTLQVLPNLKEVTAYLLLRPLLQEAAPDLLTPALVSVPELGPGDTVWWHPDLLHRLEEWNSAPHFSSVLYLAAGPDCPRNRSYLRRLRHSLLARAAPPDFPGGREAGYKGRLQLQDLTAQGLDMMGWPQGGQVQGKCLRQDVVD